jgi:hypothetical protein
LRQIFQVFIYIYICVYILHFTIISPVAAQFYHADRQTDRQTNLTKLIVAFRRLSKASKDKYSEQIRRKNWPHLQSYRSFAEIGKVKGKGKGHLRTGHEGQEEE